MIDLDVKETRIESISHVLAVLGLHSADPKHFKSYDICDESMNDGEEMIDRHSGHFEPLAELLIALNGFVRGQPAWFSVLRDDFHTPALIIREPAFLWSQSEVCEALLLPTADGLLVASIDIRVIGTYPHELMKKHHKRTNCWRTYFPAITRSRGEIFQTLQN